MNNSNGNTTDYFMTQELYEQYKFVIYLICIPVITLTGIVGNSLSLYILQKYPTKHAFATYLKVLTGIDTVLLFTALTRSLFKLFLYIKLKHASTIDTYGNYYIGLIVGSVLQRLSSTFITIISFERFLAVFFPLKIRTMFIEARPIRLISIVISSHVVLQIPTFIVVEVQEMDSLENTTLFFISRTYAASQQPVLTMVYLFSIAVLGVALPMCLVLVTTCCIIIRINVFDTRDILKYIVCRGSFETERMTFTLIGMATFFTIVSVPTVFIYVWSAVDRSIEFTFLRQLFVDINIALICINSGSDFIIYCMTSKRFRVLYFERVVCACKGTKPSSQKSQGNIQEIETVSARQDESDGTVDTFTTI